MLLGHIWVTIFGTEQNQQIEEEVRSVIVKYSNITTKIKVMQGNEYFGHYGSIQVSLNVPTRYVAIVDENCIPGSKYFFQLIHTINTDVGNTVIGSWGHGTSLPKFGSISLAQYPLYLTVCEHFKKVKNL